MINLTIITEGTLRKNADAGLFISASGQLLSDPAKFILNARNDSNQLTNDMPSINECLQNLYGLTPKITAAENAYNTIPDTPKMN